MLPAQFSEQYVRVYYKKPDADKETIRDLRTSLKEYCDDNNHTFKGIILLILFVI